MMAFIRFPDYFNEAFYLNKVVSKNRIQAISLTSSEGH